MVLLAVFLTTFFQSLSFAQESAPVARPPLQIDLNEDLVLFPPYLVDFTGGSVLNVNSSSRHQKRSVVAKEWLEYGDEFKMIPSFAVQVWMHEHIQWVGGGVLDLTVGKSEWDRKSTPYLLELRHGWMHVWVRTKGMRDEERYVLKLKTPHTEFTIQDASFWISVKPDRTEVYMVTGQMKDSEGRSIFEKRYTRWNEKHELAEVSRAWDPGATEVNIAGLYPGLVALSGKAESDWKSGKNQTGYAELRKKGKQSADRFKPTKLTPFRAPE